MPSKTLVILKNRAVMTVGGEERLSFLQGLVSANLSAATTDTAVWGALLTPQGKFQHDFFAINDADQVLFDCEAGDRLMDFGRTLHKYKLRSRVDLGIAQDWHVMAAFCEEKPNVSEGFVVADPRLKEAGWRILSPMQPDDIAAANGLTMGVTRDYDLVRARFGLPDGSRDMIPGKAILLENGFDELDGIDWKKGCYMGQELTARTKYRGLVKKRLFPVEFSSEVDEYPAEGTQILLEGQDAGELKTLSGTKGLALIRIAKAKQALAEGKTLTANGLPITVSLPGWMENILDPDGAD